MMNVRLFFRDVLLITTEENVKNDVRQALPENSAVYYCEDFGQVDFSVVSDCSNKMNYQKII